jgi:hypothetical protein
VGRRPASLSQRLPASGIELKVTNTDPTTIIQCNDNSEAATPTAIVPVTASPPVVRSIAAGFTAGNADLDGVVATATDDEKAPPSLCSLAGAQRTVV